MPKRVHIVTKAIGNIARFDYTDDVIMLFPDTDEEVLIPADSIEAIELIEIEDEPPPIETESRSQPILKHP